MRIEQTIDGNREAAIFNAEASGQYTIIFVFWLLVFSASSQTNITEIHPVRLTRLHIQLCYPTNLYPTR